MASDFPEQPPSERKKVQVWVYTRGPKGGKKAALKVLLLLTRPQRGGFWQPVTGGVENGETLAEAADREAKEETGLPFKKPPFALGRDFRYEKNGTIFHEHGFAVEVEGEPDPVLDPLEHVNSEWVDASEAFRLLAHKSNAQMLEALLRFLK